MKISMNECYRLIMFKEASLRLVLFHLINYDPLTVGAIETHVEHFFIFAKT